MKLALKVLAICTMLLTAFSPRAGMAAEVYKYSGRSATVEFIQEDYGCAYTWGWIFAGKEMVHQPPGTGSTSSRIIVSLTYKDYCTGEGFEVYGSAPLLDSDFQIDANLGSARLTATVPVSSPYPFENKSFDAVIDLTWTATSPMEHRVEQSHMHLDGYQLIQITMGDSRHAAVTGTIMGEGINFMPEYADIWGYLDNARESTIAHEPLP